MNQVHRLFKINFNIIFPSRLGLTSNFSPKILREEIIHEFFITPMLHRASGLLGLLIDKIMRRESVTIMAIFTVQFLQPLVTSSLLAPYTLLTTFFSDTHNLCFMSTCEVEFYVQTKQHVKLWFCGYRIFILTCLESQEVKRH
jgi:hypothetical protein